MKKKKLAAILLAGYILGIHRGYVALWEAPDPEPRIVTRMPADLLPPMDREALARGIPIPEDRTLAQVIEDYCS